METNTTTIEPAAFGRLQFASALWGLYRYGRVLDVNSFKSYPRWCFAWFLRSEKAVFGHFVRLSVATSFGRVQRRVPVLFDECYMAFWQYGQCTRGNSRSGSGGRLGCVTPIQVGGWNY